MEASRLTDNLIGLFVVADNTPDDDRAVPIRWAGGPQLDAVGRARAAESTLAERRSKAGPSGGTCWLVRATPRKPPWWKG